MSSVEDFDSVLWEFESAGGKPTMLEVSLIFLERTSEHETYSVV